MPRSLCATDPRTAGGRLVERKREAEAKGHEILQKPVPPITLRHDVRAFEAARRDRYNRRRRSPGRADRNQPLSRSESEPSVPALTTASVRLVTLRALSMAVT